MQVIKHGPHIRVSVNGLVVIDVKDEDYYEGGKIGFRQMANLVADYANLRVQRVSKVSAEEAE